MVALVLALVALIAFFYVLEFDADTDGRTD
jgi:hypothetical protein